MKFFSQFCKVHLKHKVRRGSISTFIALSQEWFSTVRWYFVDLKMEVLCQSFSSWFERRVHSIHLWCICATRRVLLCSRRIVRWFQYRNLKKWWRYTDTRFVDQRLHNNYFWMIGYKEENNNSFLIVELHFIIFPRKLNSICEFWGPLELYLFYPVNSIH